MDFQRFFLFMALAFLLLMIWQAWLEETQPVGPAATERAPVAPTTDGDPSVPSPGEVVPEAPVVTPADTPAPDIAEPAVVESALASVERVIVETDLVRAEIDTRGGDIRRLYLLTYPERVDEPENHFRLMHDAGPDIFVAQSGLIGTDGQYPNHTTEFEAEASEVRLAPGDDSVSTVLRWQSPDGVVYEKVYTFFRNSYEATIDYRVVNDTDSQWRGFLYGQFLRTQVPQRAGGWLTTVPSYTGGAIYTPDNRYEKISFSNMYDENLQRQVHTGWVAMLQHYFVGAWLPAPSGNYEFYSRTQYDAPGGPRYHLGYKTLSPEVIEPGNEGVLSTRLFLGPKEQRRLEQAAENLVLTVDYGWLTPVSAPLFWVLDKIHSLVNNWGWSIILLTLLIKLVFYPLSAASYKSMAKMKQLQPRLQTLRERYGDDRQKLNQAMMELYKKDKINPLGGCLPILVQIPVFIALYWVLLESVELRQADFMLWLNDLSSPDPYFVLPLLMGASMVIQQILNPAPLDPLQKKIMMSLPVVFTIFFAFFPAGLVLYWVANNVLSIAQQWYVTRKIEAASAKRT